MQGKTGGTLKNPVEQRAVQLVARGYRNGEIARELFLSEQTVGELLAAISERLGVSDRLDLILYAIIHGMLVEPTMATRECASPAIKEASAA